MKKAFTRKLSIGVIGCGGIGRVHLNNYLLHKVNIVAVADPNKNSAKQAGEQYDCHYYTDYKEMVKKEKLDGISICTPPVSHKEIVEYALNRQIHVLCEKPLAMNVKESKSIVNTAKKNRKIVMTAFCHRFQWQVVQVKKWITEGKLGDLVLFHNRFGGHFTGVEKTWFVQKKISGGGMFIDTLIHSMDLFRYLVGDAESVKAEYQTFHPKLKVEDTGVILLQSKSGAVGTLVGSWQTPTVENVIEIMGTKGAIYINYNTNLIRYRFGSQNNWETINAPDTKKDRFYFEIEHFLNAIKGQQKPLVTGEDGLKAMEILEKAYSSARN